MNEKQNWCLENPECFQLKITIFDVWNMTNGFMTNWATA